MGYFVFVPENALIPAIEPRASLSAYSAFFVGLPCPEESALFGRFRGRFVGPGWWRSLAPVVIALSGLRGWWGKDLQGWGFATNLVRKGQSIKPSHPMEMRRAPSVQDSRPCAELRYHRGFPWRLVVDELRVIDGATLLGMTRFDVPLARRFNFPFVLERVVA